MKINFIKIIFIILFALSNNEQYSEEEKENPINIDTLLEILPLAFDKLSTSFFHSQCTYSNKLTYSYFKKIESNTNIKYYLNKKENDLPSIIENILITLNITNKHYKYLYKNIYNFFYLLNDEDEYKELNWLNQIIVSISIDEKEKISYGNLFVIKKGNKIDIILCYGLIEFNNLPFEKGYFDYSEYSNINNGFIGASYVNYINTIDLADRGDRSFMIFLRIAGFKALANKYKIDIPYPRFNGFN